MKESTEVYEHDLTFEIINERQSAHIKKLEKNLEELNTKIISQTLDLGILEVKCDHLISVLIESRDRLKDFGKATNEIDYVLKHCGVENE